MFTIDQQVVAIVTDTSCDLSDEQLAQYDIRLVSLRVAVGVHEYRDRLEISQEELYEHLGKETMRTSLPMPEDVERVWNTLREEGATRILHLAMSSGLSGTYNMLCMLADEMKGVRVDVVDTGTLSAGLGLLTLTAGEMLTQGTSVEETIAVIQEKRANQLGCFVIRTLEYLRKGGRIGMIEGAIGGILHIKPVIFVNDNGVYQTLCKARGFGNAVTAMVNEVINRYGDIPVRLAIVHGNAAEEARELLERISKGLNVVSSYVSPVSPALAIHTGPGLLGAIVQPV